MTCALAARPALSVMDLGMALGAMIREREAADGARSGVNGRAARVAEARFEDVERRRDALEFLIAGTPPSALEDTVPLLIQALSLVNDIADNATEFNGEAERAAIAIERAVQMVADATGADLRALGAAFYSTTLAAA